ncbi:hypothetical protein C5167_042943 [Papaver somniferum]|uniref:Uncharacterized protein n=1 Tax=Papaver somniferum TaxID=3469 RepID=A0A4Y7L7V2_PAPSO|nr:putative uncharacterized protein DDB_G0277255 [Papaver somniferum]RZC80369.1 hypothetical protein C5167_042943 [Papaver somniferum]
MEIPKPEEQPENIQPQLNHNNNNNTLSPSSSGRNNGLLNSPEFEFWMVSNPSFPQPNLHSADELFVDGIILPLCLLSHDEQQQQHSSDENPLRNLDDVDEEVNETPISEQGLKPEPESENGPSREIGTQPGSGPESSSSAAAAASTTVFSTSKRWRDIFKVGEKKSVNNNSNNQEESKSGAEKSEKRKDRKSSGNTNNTSSTASGTNNSAELNINIWPFSRSRSAGNNNVNRPKVPLTRKVSSAPCSRSNSGSESKSRKWPSSPSRGGGIHLGRSSPVWQVRRGLNTASTTGMNKNSSEVVVKNADIKVSNVKKESNADSKVSNVKKEGSESSRWSKSRLGGGSGGGGSSGGGGVVSGLNLNVQMCMGYRQNSICRSDEHRSSLLVNGGDQNCSGGAAGNGGNGVKMFNIRTLFSSKKVY